MPTNNDRSPCLTCPHRDMDKNKCALLCLRLAAYNSGEPWERKPLPYITKQSKAKEENKMEKTEEKGMNIEHRTSNIEHRMEKQIPKEKPETPENMCVICHDPDKKVLNKRSQTCGACYQAWNTGKINHPTLGKFKPSLTKSKIKTSAAKKDQKSEIRKGQKSEVGDQKSEVGDQKSEVGNQKSEGIGDHVMSKDSKASYYDAGGIETLDIIKAKLTPEQYKGYLLGCSLKYQCRLMHKFDDKDRIRDAEKAANYSLWLLEAFREKPEVRGQRSDENKKG